MHAERTSTKLSLRANLSRHVAGSSMLFVVLTIGMLLRFGGIGSESYWVDEMITVRLLERFDVLAEELLGGRPPVYMFTAYLWSQVFGTSEIATRSLNATASSLAVLALYAFGTRLFSQKVGLLAALFMSVSAMQLYHAQDARYYSFLVLFTVLSYLYLATYLETGLPRHLTLYILTAILTFYSHSHGLFVLFAQGVGVLLSYRHLWGRLPGWVLSQVIIGGAVGFHIVRLLAIQLSGTGLSDDWLARPELVAPFKALYVFIFGYDARAVMLALALGGGAIGLLGLFTLSRTAAGERLKLLLDPLRELSRQGRQPFWPALLICWLCIPIATPFVLSFVISPMYLHRYVITASPALYLMMALALVSIRRLVPLWASIAATLLTIAPGLYLFYFEYQKEQWRDVATYIAQESLPGDALTITLGGSTLEAFNWYYKGDLKPCILPSGNVGDDALIGESISGCTQDHERLWVIERLPSTLFTAYVTKQYLPREDGARRLLEQQEFEKVTVYLYEISSP